MIDPTQTALGTWSGGKYMHFGAELDHDRLVSLVRPGNGIDTLITADAYGAGGADELAGEAIAGLPRESFCMVGAVGHDFYEGERQGAKGFQRFTDPALRGEDAYADYLRMATEKSLERVGVDQFDLLMLHNPDRTGYTSQAVWDGMAALKDAGLTRLIGVAPGPANGFTLDIIDCFERYGEMIDWSMIILNAFEPWPGELLLPAAEKYDVKLMTRVTDFGGIFHDDVRPGHRFIEHDHRQFRPQGWVEQGNEKLDAARPIAAKHGLTPLQLASWWNLAHPAVECVVPTLIEELDSSKSAEDKRADLAAVSGENPLTAEDVAALREIGDNRNCMPLKGGSPDNAGEIAADSWPIDQPLRELASRWEIEPERELVQNH
ncbi:MAG: aldo/keto reductase [Thermoleophilaceae bacterium]|nr:aldo/keto reductase [Thermoleophilaceae bacterium]